MMAFASTAETPFRRNGKDNYHRKKIVWKDQIHHLPLPSQLRKVPHLIPISKSDKVTESKEKSKETAVQKVEQKNF